ncbi:hypothetical protein NWE73_17695 [Bdellovibrio sp. PAP01]|uniref:Transglycosylase SLT domain-containing protein n=1 Tax=Bdellovibrio svalbardensis TaxID=2972972 RepID=A0ABT6DMW5_9BACT|nr:hypothetical protein [Bdellovibrio svalbardensis]
MKANHSFAANTCANDPQGTRGLGKNQSINNALKTANDPLTKAFLASIGKTDCPPPSTPIKTANDINKVVRSALPSGRIKAECIQASMQREVGNLGYSCKKGQPTAFENFKESVPCIDQKTFNFVQYSVNQALKCMSPAEDPIDPRVILRKINNETGFNFYIGYSGGVGIGQLTSDPVNEIAGWWSTSKVRDPKSKRVIKQNKYTPGNAHSILETLAANPNPACAPFKKIIEKELTTPPPSPGSKKNYCSWLSVGEGLGRSLVYGLGYYVYARDHFIKEALADRAPALLKYNDVVNTLTLVAYGPGGPAQAKSLIRTLRLNNRSKPFEVIKQVTQKSDYVSQTNDKMKELMTNMNKTSPTPEDLRGDTCVAP